MAINQAVLGPEHHDVAASLNVYGLDRDGDGVGCE